MTPSQEISVFCDGACSGNPGPGGWGAVLFFSKTVKEIGGASETTTNNQMELEAAIQSLLLLNDIGDKILMLTDSKYVIQGITSWINGWQKNNWITSTGKPVANKELWIKLLEATKNKNIKWQHIAGHANIAGNERADEIAVAFSKEEQPKLYSGPRSEYAISSDYSSSPVSPFYLSCVEGKVTKHLNWKSCEAAVKGQSGAKFKKVSSLEEEKMTLNNWKLFIKT